MGHFYDRSDTKWPRLLEKWYFFGLRPWPNWAWAKDMQNLGIFLSDWTIKFLANLMAGCQDNWMCASDRVTPHSLSG